MEAPKYEIGQIVHYTQDPEGVNGKVVALSTNGEGWMYKITSSEVDVSRRQIVNGCKHVTEEELEEVTEEQE